MAKSIPHKREYFRVNTFLPLKINVVPPDMRKGLVARLSAETDLKPAIVNISGGGLSFKALKEYTPGDILEIVMAVPEPAKITACVYGEVLRVLRTKRNHYQMFVKFISLTENMRETIVAFVFQWERTVLINTQTSQNDKFTSVPLSKFVDGTILPFEVFIKDEDGIKFMFGPGLPCDTITQEFFEEKEIQKIFIREEDLPVFDDYISKFRIKPKVFDRESAVSFKEYSFNKRLYHYIDRSVLVPHTEINFSLFTMNDYLFEHGVETFPEQPVTVDENITNLKGSLLIKKSDLPLYRTYLNSLPVPEQKAGAEGLKALVLKEHTKIIMQELFTDPLNKGALSEAVGISERIIECLRRHADSVYALLSLNSDDFFVYVHSVNVAALSVAAGLAMKLNHDILVKLCIGALLHDIGHCEINDEIVNKQGKLTKFEYEVFKTHVMEGLKILRKHEGVPPEALTAVFHHHEKLNGTGYPSGLSGNKISLFGRITAIADAYDVLTPNRPYHNRQSPFDALATIIKDSIDYDPEILKVFIKILAKAE